MVSVAVSYSPQVGGTSVKSAKKALLRVGAEVVDVDYRLLMRDVSPSDLEGLYETSHGRASLFAHAKLKTSEVLSDCDALLLPGNSAMVDPMLYGQARKKNGHYDYSRTIIELALIHVAVNSGMPVLGLCGGHQVIAVYDGGSLAELTSQTLLQQKFIDYDHVEVLPNTHLSNAMIHSGKGLRVRLFGAHTQSVSRVGENFQVSAWASDGVSIEGAESLQGVPVIATQFHPEVSVSGLPNYGWLYKYDAYTESICLNLFKNFKQLGDTYQRKKVLNDNLLAYFASNCSQPAYDKQIDGKYNFFSQQQLIGISQQLISISYHLCLGQIPLLSSVNPLRGPSKLLISAVFRPWIRAKVADHVTKQHVDRIENDAEQYTMRDYRLAWNIRRLAGFTTLTSGNIGFFRQNLTYSSVPPRDVLSSTPAVKYAARGI